MWILMVWFYVSIGGYGSSNAVTFQEFSDKVSCENALTVVYKETEGVRGKCIQK